MPPEPETHDKTAEEVLEAVEAGTIDDDEESIQFPPPSLPHKAPVSGRQLSVISKKYDRGNKGYLDEEEKALRLMDSQNLGYLDTNKALHMFHELRDAQAKNVTNRKIIIALSVFAVLLSLANIGTAFAAATLAKDTSVTDGQLVDKSTGTRLAVTAQTITVRLDEGNSTAPSEGQRKLQTKQSTVTKESAVALLSELCTYVPRNLDFSRARVDPASAWCTRTDDILLNILHCSNPTYNTYAWFQEGPTYSSDGFNEFITFIFMSQRAGVITGYIGLKCNLANYIDECEVGDVVPNVTQTDLYCSIPCAPTTLCPSYWWCPEPNEVCNYNVATTAECGQCTATSPV